MTVTSWTLLCDLQLAVTAAEKEPGKLCRKEDILHLLSGWSFPPEEQKAVFFFLFLFFSVSLSASAA